MSLPWSSKGEKLTIVDADEFMILDSEDAVAATKNKRVARGIAFPNASNSLPVKSQADLVAEFGASIIIPAGEFWTVQVLESFTMTLPFRIGSGSVLKITEASTNLKITYTGTGALFQNETAGVPIAELILDDIDFAGNGTNDIFDIETSATGVIRLDTTQFDTFDSIGVWKGNFFDVDFSSVSGVNTGLVIDDMTGGNFNRFSLNQGASGTPLVFITVVSPTKTTQIIADGLFTFDTDASLLFLDPNSPAGARSSITGTTGFFADLFQQGITDSVTAVADAGGGNTRFTIASTTGLVAGDVVIHSNMVGQPTYNGAFIVNNIFSATQYHVELAFVATTTGDMTSASLNETDLKVNATNNTDTADSMFIGGFFHPDNDATTTVLDGTFGPLDLSGGTAMGVTAFTENERFNVSDVDEGVIEYNGLIPKTVTLIAILSMNRAASRNYNLRFAIDRGAGFVAMPTALERLQNVSSTFRDTSINQEVVVNTGDKIRIEIEGIGHADSLDVLFASLDIKG